MSVRVKGAVLGGFQSGMTEEGMPRDSRLFVLVES